MKDRVHGCLKCKFDSEPGSRAWKPAFLSVPVRLPDPRPEGRAGKA